MAATWEQLAEQAMALSSESRARLADRLVESLDVDDLGPMDRLSVSKPLHSRTILPLIDTSLVRLSLETSTGTLHTSVFIWQVPVLSSRQ
jgi:hypothetical protein